MLKKRVWLNDNKSHDDGAVIYSIDGNGKELDATLKFSDCNRSVSLSFDSYGDKQKAKKRLKKARLLQRCVDEFVEELEQAIEEAYK